VATGIAAKKFDEVDAAAEMQANSSVANLMPALVFEAVDSNLHSIEEYKRAARRSGVAGSIQSRRYAGVGRGQKT